MSAPSIADGLPTLQQLARLATLEAAIARAVEALAAVAPFSPDLIELRRIAAEGQR